METIINNYSRNLSEALSGPVMQQVPVLASALQSAWANGNTVFICGNGGSAGNAIHLANDFIFGAGKKAGIGIRVEALSANAAVLTCLANDTGYENVYAEQLRVKGSAGDVLIALSGSGNSPNIVNAISMANDKGMKSFAILGFSGGKCKELAQVPIHFEIHDMQVSEDLQMIVGHICMQWLYENLKKD